MRQLENNYFSNLLNHVRTVDLDDYDVSILKSRFLLPTESYPKNASQKMPQQIFTRSEDKFQRLSVGYRVTVRIDFYDSLQGKSYVNLNKINFMNFSFRVLLLYRRNSENLDNFYENLIEINTHQKC